MFQDRCLVVVRGMSEKAEDKLGFEASVHNVVKRVENLEREVNRLKALVPFRSEALRPNLVSFRGMAKLLVSLDELERSIEEAKASPFRHEL